MLLFGLNLVLCDKMKINGYSYPVIKKRFTGGKTQFFFTDYTLILDDDVYQCIGKFEDGVEGWVLLVPKIVKNILVGHIAFEWGII